MGMTPEEIMWERSVGAKERTREIIARIRQRADERSPATSRFLRAEANRLEREFLGSGQKSSS